MSDLSRRLIVANAIRLADRVRDRGPSRGDPRSPPRGRQRRRPRIIARREGAVTKKAPAGRGYQRGSLQWSDFRPNASASQGEKGGDRSATLQSHQVLHDTEGRSHVGCILVMLVDFTALAEIDDTRFHLQPLKCLSRRGDDSVNGRTAGNRRTIQGHDFGFRQAGRIRGQAQLAPHLAR
jgi:hypothetical protein